MSIIFHLLIIGLVNNLVFCYLDCPEPESIAPCTCAESTISCGGDGPIDMDKIFTNLSLLLGKQKVGDKDRQYYEIFINNTVITELTDNMFKDIKFHTIFIHKAHSLKKIHKNAFQATLPYTKIIVLKKCKSFDSLELWDLLNSFSQMETICIGNINITEIPAKLFKPLEHLFSVAFTGPNFQKIGEKPFYELKKMRFVDLINTSISHISDDIFVFKPSDIKINIGLYHNQLNGTGFSEGAFAHIGRPADIHYMGFDNEESSEQIKFLDQKAFEPFFKLDKQNKVMLRYEVLDCNDCRNKWLKEDQYKSRLPHLRCSNKKPFDSNENFASC